MLERLEQLEKAATPGPLSIVEGEGYAVCPDVGIVIDYSISYPDERTAEDLEYLVALHNAAPALLAVAKAAEALANAEARQRVVKTPSGDFGGDFAACGKWIMDRDNDLKVAAIQVRDALAQLKEQE